MKMSINAIMPRDHQSQLTASKCNEANPLLESKDFYKGQCCFVKTNLDPLYSLKQNYRENWKEAAISIYEVDENISDEDLLEVALSEETEGLNDQCRIILDNSKEVSLYEMALLAVNKTIKYDCGNGEKTFSARNFNPKNEKEEIDKDLADCGNSNENYIEKKMFKTRK